MGSTTSIANAGSTWVPIATQPIANNTTSTISFTSIPQTYTDLILVFSGTMVSGGGSTFHYQFNNDTGTSYSTTVMYGNSSQPGSYRYTGSTAILGDVIYTTQATNIVHILNYTNTNMYKTALSKNAESSTAIRECIGLWRDTSAINRMDIFTDNLSVCYFASGSAFTLYGIKAA